MARKIKVLHLVSILDKVGGLEKLVAQIVTHLDKDHYEAEIWAIARAGSYAQHLQAQGIKVKDLGISNYYLPWNILKLAWLLRQSKADIVHTHIYFAATIGRIAARLAGVKVVINHVHSAYRHYTWRNVLIERMLSKLTDCILCVSKSVQYYVLHYEKIDPSKTRLVYNGIELPQRISRTEARRAMGIDEASFIITSVANLYENKGHRVLFDALKRLKDQGRVFQCWVVGQGPLEMQLKTYAKELGLDSRVVFWGERQDVPSMLFASDIFVLASVYREGLAIAAIEAMACGLPVILSDVGGLTELIKDHKEGGLVVAHGNASQLSQAIGELMDDPCLRQRLTEGGFKRYQQEFEVSKMVKAIEKIYQEHLAK